MADNIEISSSVGIDGNTYTRYSLVKDVDNG